MFQKLFGANFCITCKKADLTHVLQHLYLSQDIFHLTLSPLPLVQIYAKFYRALFHPAFFASLLLHEKFFPCKLSSVIFCPLVSLNVSLNLYSYSKFSFHALFHLVIYAHAFFHLLIFFIHVYCCLVTFHSRIICAAFYSTHLC